MKEQKNMAGADRALRTLFAAAVLAMWTTGAIGGTLALILGIVALIFLATSLVGWCPLYGVLGVATRREGGDGRGGGGAAAR